MKYQAVKKTILQRLKEELPAYLYYHNIQHVLDVLKACEEIAACENVKGNSLTLLKTAALFHDAGFIEGPQYHEQTSCRIAQDTLPFYNYSQQQIDIIKGMIMATRIPQSPQNHLEQILADADLDYLGRHDFYKIGQGLFEELKHFGVVATENEWNKIQEKFLSAHTYHTRTSIKKRNVRKKKHIGEIQAKLKDK